MISNYFKSALRNLRRHKGYAFLNIAGLAIGLTAATLILVYVQFEWSFDRFNSKADRIYRIYKRDPGNVFIGSDYFAVTPAPLGKGMESDLPAVEKSVTIRSDGGLVRAGEHAYLEPGAYFATPSIFTVFDFPLVEGNERTALADPFTAVLSEELAKKYFGSQDPVGKTIRLWDKYDLKVTGVMKDVPENSHLRPTLLSSFATYVATVTEKSNLSWENSSNYTYVLLRPGADPAVLQSQLPAFAAKYLEKPRNEEERQRQTQFFLQPLKDIHLYSSFINFGPPGNDLRLIYVLLALAMVILLTASINYMNLSTARASLRGREVGMRKVVGAQRSDLIRQFIGESLLYAVIASAIAILAVEMLLPAFSHLVDRTLPLSLLTNGTILLGFAVLAILLGVVSGSYPAFVLSSFQPVKVLKGLNRGRSRSSIRNILVIVQCSASTALIICTFIILNQLHYIRTSNLGYDREQVLTLRIRGLTWAEMVAADTHDRVQLLKNRLLQYSNIIDATATSHLPIQVGSSGGITIKDDQGAERKGQSYQLYTDSNFLKVFRIPLKAGRFFRASDPADQDAAVINETFARTYGWKNPVGNTFLRGSRSVTVVGVVQDFHMHSLHEPIAPLFIGPSNAGWVGYIAMRIRPNDIPGTIAFVKNTWKKLTTYPINYSFLDEDFDKMYRNEERLSQIVSWFASLAIIVASLGLFGLAAFVVEQRKKEIGIRKVLGASIPGVVAHLSREFLALVVIANLIAWPAAFFLMRSWLQDFAYRISLSAGPFLLAGLAAVLVAFATVSYQSIRAARANPVDSLKYE